MKNQMTFCRRAFVVFIAVLLLVACNRSSGVDCSEPGLWPIDVPYEDDYRGIDGYIDCHGNVVIDYQFAGADEFSGGFAIVENRAGKYGYINTDGEVVSGYLFDFAQPFSDGLAIARIGEEWHFYNTDFEPVIEVPYAEPFSEGLAQYKESFENWGYIDTSGEVVIEPQWVQVDAFSDGLAAVYDADGPIGYINRDGELQIEIEEFYMGEFVDGIAIMRTYYGELYAIDTQGERVLTDYTIRGFVGEGLVPVEVDGGVGYATVDGELAIAGPFTRARAFHEGMAPVTVEGSDLWGHINREGEVVIEPAFERASWFYGDLASVQLPEGDGVWAYVNREGKIVWRHDVATEEYAER